MDLLVTGATMHDVTQTSDSWDDLTVQERADFKDTFHEAVQGATVQINTTEVFAGGMCARTGKIPAGVVFIGRAHKQEQIQVLSEGAIELFGHSRQIIRAPHVFKGSIGDKRLVRTLEDTVWTTILKTDATCIEDVVAECTTLTLAELKTQVGNDVCGSSSDGSNCNIRREP